MTTSLIPNMKNIMNVIAITNMKKNIMSVIATNTKNTTPPSSKKSNPPFNTAMWR